MVIYFWVIPGDWTLDKTFKDMVAYVIVIIIINLFLIPTFGQIFPVFICKNPLDPHLSASRFISAWKFQNAFSI